MKRNAYSLLLAALILLSAAASGCRADGTPGAPPEKLRFNGTRYTLALSDDFDSLDESNWAYCPEGERQDAGGMWRDSCCGIENGNLVITCSVDDDGVPVSGGIRSLKDHEQAFGLYHIRFKMEKADGLWYAFWLLSDEMNDRTAGNGATDGAELDIMEVVPYSRSLYMSLHWDGYGEYRKSCHELVFVDDSFYDDYHELWYQWDDEGYRLYLDGTDNDSLLFFFPGDRYGDGTCTVPCDLIISAEYGSWGGRIREEQLPAHFYVDYVRVYRQG